MKGCEKYIELISERIDGEISNADRSDLERHLELCPECRKVAEAFAAISDSFPMEEPVPENFTSGTMAKIRAVSAEPTGIKKFISAYGRYTGLAAALVVVLLGVRVFTGGTANDTAAYLSNTGSAPMAPAKGEPTMEASHSEAESIFITTDAGEERFFDAGVSAPMEAIAGSTSVNDDMNALDYAPVPAPDAAAPSPETQLSVTVQVTDVNELYNKMGYQERFYSVSRLSEPLSEELSELLESGESTQIFRSLHEKHYKVPIAQLNELDSEIFTEIVFDDLTAQYGLVILMTAEE